MTTSNKARRATIKLGAIDLEVFRLPSGEYALSQTQVANAVGKDEQIVRIFLRSKWLKDLLGEVSRAVHFKLSAEGKGHTVKAVNPEIAFAFWQKESESGNAIARRLVFACGVESIERRADKIFKKFRTEDDYNDRMSSRILTTADPYSVLFEKELCDKGFKWYGSNFYWIYFYFWMNKKERCDLDTNNPIVNGTRKYKIHQWIEGETKERLKEKARELAILLLRSNCKQSFEATFAEWYGGTWQQRLF
jgi:hypothetical protein